MEKHLLVYYLAGVPLLGVTAQWLAWRLRIPSILVLLIFGVSLGSFVQLDELLGHLGNENGDLGAQLLFPVVSLSVAVILFEGGLSLQFHELKQAGGVLLRLVTVGALGTWVLTAMAAWWLLNWPLSMSALIGAILVVTGPTVVAPLLRHIRPARRVGSIAKWEGIVIDPIGAVLAVLVFEEVLVHSGRGSLADSVVMVAKSASVGVVLSGATATVLIQAVKRYWIPDFLHGVAFLAVALGVFAVSNVLQPESGLVTVTLLGIILANQKSIPIHHVVEFKEHLRTLLLSCLFIVLGSRLELYDIYQLGWSGVFFLAAIILIIRPASVYLATLGSNISWRERTFLAFLAPRGIVAAAISSVFALQIAALAGDNRALTGLAEQAEQLVPITFLVIGGTVAIYGLLAAPLARWLELADPDPQGVLFANAEGWVRDIALALQNEGFSVLLVDKNYAHVADSKMAGLPAECSNILSELVLEDMDLGGVGRLLAVTPNDEVNALAASEYAHVFGRANVYQLPPGVESSTRRTSVAFRLQGRILFEPELNYEELHHRVAQGAVVKTTQITEEFPFEKFLEFYGESATVLFLIQGKDKLEICTADKEATPKAGQTVIALVQTPPQN